MALPESAVQGGLSNIDLSAGMVRIGVDYVPSAEYRDPPPDLQTVLKELHRIQDMLVAVEDGLADKIEELQFTVDAIQHTLENPWYVRWWRKVRQVLGL